MKIRRATELDVESFLQFKNDYPIPHDQTSSRSGFLMGSSPNDYLKFVAQDYVWVVEEDGEIGGYSIVLGDTSTRESNFWKHRDSIHWQGISADIFGDARVCFFEQLAVKPSLRSKVYGKNLGIRCLAEAFRLNHDFALTTVVHYPVHNFSSRGFVLAAGFLPCGTIEEDYPHMKGVISDVFWMDRDRFISQMNGDYSVLAQKVLGPNWKQNFEKV